VATDYAAGRQFRAVRCSKHLTQCEVARRAGVSRPIVSRLERGLCDGLTLRSIRAVSLAVGMPPLAILGWRGPEVERLLDAGHAVLVEMMIERLSADRWSALAEYSFSEYGERGSVDILAWHPATSTLLIVEVKTRMWDLQEMLATIDRKRRLLRGVVARERGWRPRAVGVVLAMADTRTNRRMIERHNATFGVALPQRQAEVKHWLGSPVGTLNGILFLTSAPHKSTTRKPTTKKG
jgi:transcriptional regulator with XRE-family HTH domain